jgi:hypothetical protein
MISIQFPQPEFRIKKKENREYIFDVLRKRWLLLTPEEWVRQNFVQYLVKIKNYPSALIALEKEIQLGELKKRFDVLIYNKDHKPWMMIECKGSEIKLNDAVLQQASRYNISVPVEFIIITNGSFTYGWQRSGGDLKLMNDLPVL